jgi:TonB family protein
MKKKYAVLFFVLAPVLASSQNLVKECFNGEDKPVDESLAAYCVVGKKILRIDSDGASDFRDTVESYVDTVKAYYAGDKKPKWLKIYNDKGYEDGNFIEFYPSGRLKERGSYKDGSRIGYVSRYYPEGNAWSTLQFFSKDKKISDWDETNFMIMTYNDATGNPLVVSGNGFCRCELLSGRTEVGKVVDGVRDSVWSEYSGNTLVLQEHYTMGNLTEGVRFYNGKALKYWKAAELPEYVDGKKGIASVLKKNLKYPAANSRNNSTRTVIANFLVNEDGSVSDAKIIQSANKAYDREALRVVKLLKKWNPARLRGKPVAVRVSLPINF